MKPYKEEYNDKTSLVGGDSGDAVVAVVEVVEETYLPLEMVMVEVLVVAAVVELIVVQK